MRTTVIIDDGLLQQVREIAARSQRSLSQVIEDAVRTHVSVREEAEARPPVVLPVYGGSGLQPGVDLEDKESLAALLDE